jgi:pfkB family carbohydrate kinase.
MRVTVVGDCTLDVIVRPVGALRPGGDIPARVAVGAGGQGANVAVRLARQGVPVQLEIGRASCRERV